jgi:hypothetical protein
VCQKEDWRWHKRVCKPAPKKEEWIGMRVDMASDRSADKTCEIQWRAEDTQETLVALAKAHLPAQINRHCMLTFHNANAVDKGTVLFRDDVTLDLLCAVLHKTYPRETRPQWMSKLAAHALHDDTICCATFVLFRAGEEMPESTRQLCIIRVAGTNETVIM